MANSTGTAASCDQTHNSTQYFSNFTLGRQNLGLHGSTLILRASTRPYTAILQASHSLTFRYVSNRHPRARSVAFHGKQGLLCPWKRASHLRINSVKNVHILQPPRILSLKIQRSFPLSRPLSARCFIAFGLGMTFRGRANEGTANHVQATHIVPTSRCYGSNGYSNQQLLLSMSQLREGILPSLLLLLDELLTVLVHLELGDDDVRRVDRDERGLAGELCDGNGLDVDPHRPELDGGDAAGPAPELATDDLNLVIAADGEALDAVGLLELLRERGAERDMLLLLGRVEEGLADLAGLGRNERVRLHMRKG